MIQYQRLILILLAAAAIGIPDRAGAQPFEIDWYTFPGGGGTSAGADFTLQGSIGQPAADECSSTDYVLSAGHWTVIETNPLVNCCRGVTCTSIPTLSCDGVFAGSQSRIVGVCGPGNAVATCCFADYDHNGVSNINDIFIYLNAWFMNSPYATFGGNGIDLPMVDDIFLFLNAWFGGCS